MPLHPDDPAHPRALLRPMLLLLLLEDSGYGYELVARLKAFGFGYGGSGRVYNMLRKMEEEHLAMSVWDSSRPGPPRRVYAITDCGRAKLREWSANLNELSSILISYTERYEQATHGQPSVRFGQGRG